MKPSDVILILVGLGFCLFGAIFVVGGLANALDPREGSSALIFVLATLFFGIAPLVLGCGILMWSFRRRSQRNKETHERLILSLARQRGGRLTVADVALNTSLSSDQAQKLLEQCHLDGLSYVDVSDQGVVEYIFQGLQGSEG